MMLTDADLEAMERQARAAYACFLGTDGNRVCSYRQRGDGSVETHFFCERLDGDVLVSDDAMRQQVVDVIRWFRDGSTAQLRLIAALREARALLMRLEQCRFYSPEPHCPVCAACLAAREPHSGDCVLAAMLTMPIAATESAEKPPLAPNPSP